MRTWDEVLVILRSSPGWKNLEKYLDLYFDKSPHLQEVWSIMDQVWDDMGLDNKKYDEKKLSEYYSHPVWLLNGLWIETDSISMQHRRGMAHYVEGDSPRVLDYGGGLGALAKQIALHYPEADIEIYEPHASNFAHDNIRDFDNIKIVDKLDNKEYDYIFTTDVIEHVDDPISFIININRHLATGGIMVAAWNFSPCIKCHLPENFHYRYTMRRWIIPSLGFSYIEKAKGGHGHIYKKVKEINSHLSKSAYGLALVSKSIYPVFRALSFAKGLIKNTTAQFRLL